VLLVMYTIYKIKFIFYLFCYIYVFKVLVMVCSEVSCAFYALQCQF
jgi:hypothetical protein